MKNITKDTIKSIRSILDKAYMDIAAQTGVQLKTGAIRYSNTTLRYSVTGEIIPDGVDASDPDAIARADFEKNTVYFYGDPDWYGKDITIDGKTYTICAIRKNAKKNSFLVRLKSTGKEYCCSAEQIRDAMGLLKP